VGWACNFSQLIKLHFIVTFTVDHATGNNWTAKRSETYSCCFPNRVTFLSHENEYIYIYIYTTSIVCYLHRAKWFKRRRDVFGGYPGNMSAGTMIMLRVFVIYLSFSKLTSRYYLKLLHDYVNPYPFWFISNCHPIIRSYLAMKKYFLLALLGFIVLRLYGH
jgi:hypothetical protein